MGTTPKTTSKQAEEPVPSTLRFLIERLDAHLQQEYGVDFAYKIVGRGKTLAASNLRDGRVTPRSR